MKKEWLIFSLEHDAWWKSDEKGYIDMREHAGLYTLEDALRIVKNANIGLGDRPNEAMVQATKEEVDNGEWIDRIKK